ncbi:uncharacterized protein LOC128324879 isoform X2 [Hemicordylus capensis]|uniref:uncharacterized protein LOC128324879 isoform X2 n=1 Tax=Hemicordylus capensis TaxID=884348 RepID=UPI002302B9CE|nr:uncharacterized protein LOC128324879 isoform X2 [Hemicordylus capensis]
MHLRRCGNLFTVSMEMKAEGRGFRRVTAKILEFSGGDERPSTNLFLPLFWASSPASLPAEAGFLPWILKHLLQENAFTFLLLCLTLPDASGEEILSALSLAEKVRAVAKRVSPVHWDPVQEAQKRRAVIGELRAQLFFHTRPEQDSTIGQLGRVMKELQVLKKQSWGEKKLTSAAYEIKEDPCLEARGQFLSEIDSGDEKGNHLGSKLSQSDTHQEEEGSSTSEIDLGQMGVHEGATEEKPFTDAAYKTRNLNGATRTPSPSWANQQYQDPEVRFSLAKAKRQCLKEQHQSMIQQELLKMELELAGQEKLPSVQQEALLWQKEKTLLTLRLEALQREQAEAERDLEELNKEHRHEVEAQKQHILQVFQAYRRHAEEQMNTLEQKYRKLLQESLQDAIILSTQNQQLQAQKQLSCTERAAQTDFQPVRLTHESHPPS